MCLLLGPQEHAAGVVTLKDLNSRQQVQVPAGISVWAAMAQSGQQTTRLAPVTEQERSAYCAMGVCFECLVEIDGIPNRQACLTPVEEGMRIERQHITENTYALPTADGGFVTENNVTEHGVAGRAFDQSSALAVDAMATDKASARSSEQARISTQTRVSTQAKTSVQEDDHV